MTTLVPMEYIEQRIWLIRGNKVMLDIHLAELYGIEVVVLPKPSKEIWLDFQTTSYFNLQIKRLQS